MNDSRCDGASATHVAISVDRDDDGGSARAEAIRVPPGADPRDHLPPSSNHLSSVQTAERFEQEVVVNLPAWAREHYLEEGYVGHAQLALSRRPGRPPPPFSTGRAFR